MIVSVLFVAVAVLGVLVVLLLGSQVEMYRDIAQIREYAGLIDRPIPIELGSSKGVKPSEVGLPEHLDSATSAVVLFLSDRCATCRSIASAFGGVVPQGVQLVIEPGSAPPGAALAQSYGFRSDQVIVDWGRRITDRIGIEVTPAGIVVEQGRLVSASTLPSTRQVYSLMERVRTIRVGERAQADLLTMEESK
jgi:hypothetical protein